VGRSAAKSCGRGRPVRTALRERVRARVQGCAHVERRCTDGGRRLFRALVEDLYRRVQLPPSWVSRLTEELEALVRPRTAAGSRAAEPQCTPVADPVWRTWTRSSTRSPAASTHPDPATLLDISTTACRRMRSAPAPVQTRSPALLLGLHVFSALGGDGLGRSQA
jgi:hypothetical protein